MTRPTLSLVASFTGGDEDLTDFGREGITISRGTSSITTTGFVADAGTYETALDNIDRRFDPNYSVGPYNGGADIIPGVPVTATANWNAQPFPLLAGFVGGWPQDYPLNGADQVVHLHATDGTALFSNGSLYIQRGAEYSGARITAVAAALGWTGSTQIAHGNAVLTPLKLGTVTAWSHMTDVANAEWGELYFSAGGVLIFRSRDEMLSDTRSTVSQATFVQSGGFNYSGVTMGSPPIVNDCTISHNDRGDEVNAQDAASIASLWKVHSLPLSLPLKTATQAQQYANWVVARYKTPITTFASITLTPSNEPGDTFDLWSLCLDRELGDLITVTLDPLILSGNDRVLSGEPITRECWIRGIQHNISDADWTVTFYLQDASWRTGLWKWDVSEWDGPDVWAL